APVFPAEVQQSMQTTQSCQWQCIIGRKKRWKPDELLETEISVKGQSVVLRVSWIEREENILQFDWEAADIVWVDLIEAMGKLPLPPYIQREASEADQKQYQTVYSRHQGAVAAPTAGLHFTDQVFSNLAKKNIHPHALTLHVSAGTFLPVKTDKVVEHDMHAEQFVISREMLIKLRDRNTAVVPVGTTSMRVLESLYWMGKKLLVQKSNDAFLKLDALAPYEKGSAPSLTEAIHALLTHLDQHQMDSLHGETSIFIMPGYKFKLCDGIITNFHMPGTTLILLVAALLGEDWRKVYEAALENDYRFLSYGDSSLLWRNGR
ncbi:MAG: S-adenosylmethionine:tRNA ribosyltransferase-isomerase, partial [Bacteroidota bacterium]